tara:strand:- start:106 stop:597 length:492 start_codon:yes stop_codon:yes gene_type:complete
MEDLDLEEVFVLENDVIPNQWNMNLFEQLTSLEGRINRLRYILLTLLSFPIMILIFIPNLIISIFIPEILWPILDTIFYSPVVYILYSITIKRLYDTGRSGGWILYAQIYSVLLLLYLISPIGSDIEFLLDLVTTIFGFPLGIVCLFFKGDIGDNEHGPDPLA